MNLTKGVIAVNISLKKASTKATTKTLFFYPSGAKLPKFAKDCPKALASDMGKDLAEQGWSGQFGDIFYLRNWQGENYLFVGTGDPKLLNPEKLRCLSAKIFKKLGSEKISTLQIPVDQLPGRTDSAKAVSAFTEGLLLSSYTFDDFKAPKEKKEISVELTHSRLSKTMTSALNDSLILGDSQNFSRWLGDCPGNFMTPTELAKQTQKKAKGTSLKVTVWDKARIKKEKMESLLGVSAGSSEDPRFIIMSYKGAAASKKPVCFVGKGLTFDSGGISLKPSAGMQEMKYDMCGGANVIGAVLAIARLKLKVNVLGLVPSSENMPGPAANKPGDIRKARNGKSIEINNTDAEGRLILADALSYATEQKPAWIVDAATLTGAMMIALGRTHTGFYSNNKNMVSLMGKASQSSEEQVWRMPLTDAHVKDMKGTYADINNIGPHRFAGSAQAAAFLSYFVGEDIPWLHCDIAGTAWHVGKYFPYHPSVGASGAMVRTFVEMARHHKS